MSPPDLSQSQADIGKAFSTSKVLGKPVVPCPDYWIEIELVDRDGNPVPGEEYRITLPGGDAGEGCSSTVLCGALDQKGFARHSGLPKPGVCQIEFPRLHAKSWDRIA